MPGNILSLFLFNLDNFKVKFDKETLSNLTTVPQLLAFLGAVIGMRLGLRYARLNNLYHRHWGVVHVNFGARGSLRLGCKISKPMPLISK